MKNVFGLTRLAVAIAAAASVSFLAVAADQQDVTGTWTMSVETPYGSGSPTFTLTQRGEEIAGNYKGYFGEAPVEGTIKDGEVTLSIEVVAQGQDLKVDYIGTVEGDSMAGKVLFRGLGEGTFKGARERPTQE